MADWTLKIRAPLNRVWRREGYIDGHVVTSVGIVYAYSEHDDKQSGTKGATNLQFAWGGRLYSLGLKRPYTQRGLVTIANRFAQEVADGEHEPQR